jgi:hypothetical protein
MNNDECILIITFLGVFIAATCQDSLSGASPSDQFDFLSSVPSTHHPFHTFRSRSRSCLDMKFPPPQSQPQPDMLPEFDHQQQTSPQVCVIHCNIEFSLKNIT